MPGEACPNAVIFEKAYKRRSLGPTKMHERLWKERSSVTFNSHGHLVKDQIIKIRKLDNKLKSEVRELKITKLEHNEKIEEIMKREFGLENIQQNIKTGQIINDNKNKCLTQIGQSIEKVISLCSPHMDNSVKMKLLLESIITGNTFGKEGIYVLQKILKILANKVFKPCKLACSCALVGAGSVNLAAITAVRSTEELEKYERGMMCTGQSVRRMNRLLENWGGLTFGLDIQKIGTR